MKRTALFPFDRKLLPVVRHFKEMQKEYELVELVAMPGMGLAGKDAAFACNQCSIGIQVTDELKLDSCKWDTMLLAQEHMPANFDEQCLVSDILSHGKELIVSAHSLETIPEWLVELEKNEKRLQIRYGEGKWARDLEITDYKRIDTPVLLVGGIVEEADILEVTLAITTFLKDRGFVVETLTKEAVAGLFGCLDYEPIYFRNDEENDKILRLNQFLHTIEQKTVPDIIVIEAPDAMIRFNDLVPNGFGIRTYMLCQAVNVDFVVCCMPYEVAQEGFIKLLDQDFRLRYGVGIGMVHASNVLVDSADMVANKRMAVFYDKCDRMETFLQKKGLETGIPVSNVIVHEKEFRKYLQNLLENEEEIDGK